MTEKFPIEPKSQLYRQLAQTAEALFAGETDRIANAANLSALIFSTVPDLNWAGFYFFDGTELVVGPFQGQPACVRIPLGKGVCGTAALEGTTQVVDDVDQFPSHIACDAASRSEIVIPLKNNDQLLGVLDVDSPTLGRFDDEDRIGMESLARIYLDSIG